MGWSWLFPNVSTFVVSEYNIINKNLASIGKDFSTPSHHVPVFCSLYILFPLYFNNMIFISKYNKYNIIHIIDIITSSFLKFRLKFCDMSGIDRIFFIQLIKD